MLGTSGVSTCRMPSPGEQKLKSPAIQVDLAVGIAAAQALPSLMAASTRLALSGLISKWWMLNTLSLQLGKGTSM